MGFFRCKIDVTKIDKDKDLFKSEKSGAIYLDYTMSERKEKSKHGATHSIYIKKSKEDEKRYIGDAEYIDGPSPGGEAQGAKIKDDEIPF